MDRLTVNGKGRTWNVVTAPHRFQRGSIGGQDRAELCVAVATRFFIFSPVISVESSNAGEA